MQSQSNTSNRGFASMNTEKQKEIARKGGRAAHEKGTAHEFTPDEARQAGRKGGERVSANREHMSRIGRLGGKSSASRRRTGGEAGAGATEHAGENNGGGNGSFPGSQGGEPSAHTAPDVGAND